MLPRKAGCRLANDPSKVSSPSRWTARQPFYTPMDGEPSGSLASGMEAAL